MSAINVKIVLNAQGISHFAKSFTDLTATYPARIQKFYDHKRLSASLSWTPLYLLAYFFRLIGYLQEHRNRRKMFPNSRSDYCSSVSTVCTETVFQYSRSNNCFLSRYQPMTRSPRSLVERFKTMRLSTGKSQGSALSQLGGLTTPDLQKSAILQKSISRSKFLQGRRTTFSTELVYSDLSKAPAHYRAATET